MIDSVYYSIIDGLCSNYDADLVLLSSLETKRMGTALDKLFSELTPESLESISSDHYLQMSSFVGVYGGGAGGKRIDITSILKSAGFEYGELLAQKTTTGKKVKNNKRRGGSPIVFQASSISETALVDSDVSVSILCSRCFGRLVLFEYLFISLYMS